MRCEERGEARYEVNRKTPQAYSEAAAAIGSHARLGKLSEEGQGADGIMEGVARLWSDAAAATIGRMAMD